VSFWFFDYCPIYFCCPRFPTEIHIPFWLWSFGLHWQSNWVKDWTTQQVVCTLLLWCFQVQSMHMFLVIL
jgi:hypothetical protein